jgi:predicted unusual protein kinase regulating ubiquinone biosynthesis (AarF/ABC1/UbiB family)
MKKSRLGRLSSLGALGASVAGGAASALAGAVQGSSIGRRFHEATAERLLSTLSEMKGLPMKLGQILSYMDGVVPPEYQATCNQ